MCRLRGWLWSVGLLVLALAASGCGDNQRVSNDLKRLGLAYHNFCEATQAAPTGPKDLEPYYERDPRLTQALDSGQYVFLWNVSFQELIRGGGGGGGSSTVLAYEKDAPTRGGLVLLADGGVEHRTAQQFAQAPKATPPSKKD